MNDIYTGIELGTDTIKIVISSKIHDKFQVLASITSPSMGIKGGIITDIKACVNSCKEALKKIEKNIGIKISKAILCISAKDVEMSIVSGEVDVIDYQEITGVDVSNVLLKALKQEDFNDRELVTAIPIYFEVDDKGQVKDPKNLKGSLLKTKVVISTVPKEPLYRMLEVLKLSGVEIVDIAFSIVGDYYTIKNKRHDDEVGCIVNIGEDTTKIAIFNKGILIKYQEVLIGSVNVDKDISYVFKSDLAESRKIKEQFSIAYASLADLNDMWQLKATNKEINQVAVSKVVESRVREILKLAKKEIKNLTNREIRYIIVTGGLSEMSGFQNVLEQEFGFVAKVCNIHTMGVRHNKFSSSYGITKYFDDKLSLRGKSYNLFSQDDIDSLLSIDKALTNENMLSKVFGQFFDH